jgi:hypothetical protein
MSSKPKRKVKPASLEFTQHGGAHYKGLTIEPVEYAMLNELDCCQFSVVKYVTRHRTKGGAEDIKKAMHYLQMILEMDYDTHTQVTFEEKEAK